MNFKAQGLMRRATKDSVGVPLMVSSPESLNEILQFVDTQK